MNKQEDGKKFNELFDGLFGDMKANSEEIKQDLEALGVNYQKIELQIDQILNSANRMKKLSWLSEAQRTRSKITSVFEKQSQEIQNRYKDVRELIQAIQRGQFGPPLQQQANAFFRNQDFKNLSEQDLISFVTDCQLLDALTHEEGNKR